MSTRNTQNASYCPNTLDFNRKIEEGIKRAPAERAKAMKDFWNWFTRTAK